MTQDERWNIRYKDGNGTGQWHSEGTSSIFRAIKMVVDAFENKGMNGRS